jgi:hypothetical protein
MPNGHLSDGELCERLRENGSGDHELAAQAAARINDLRRALVRTQQSARTARLRAKGHECDCKRACMTIEQRAESVLGGRTV